MNKKWRRQIIKSNEWKNGDVKLLNQKQNSNLLIKQIKILETNILTKFE